MTNVSENKFIIFKGLYWNHPIELLQVNHEEAEQKRLEHERKMLAKPGTLNFLANENIFKHKELVNYLEKKLDENIEFRLNNEPYILADYELKNTLTIENVKDILGISGFGVYNLVEVKEEFKGSYLLLLSEDYGFENEYDKIESYIFSDNIEAEIGVTKYLINQISNHSASFARIREAESKTSKFKAFIDGLQFFDFYEGYSIIQPKKELMKINELNDKEEIKNIKSEIDLILDYTNSKVYKVVQM